VANSTRGYRRRAVRVGINGRGVQLASAVTAVVVTILLAARSAWPFDAPRPRLPARPSLWQLLLSDYVTLGFVRLALVMLAVFVIASVPALVAGGRWLKSFGAGGLIADDATHLRDLLDVTERELERTTRALAAMKKERDEAVAFAARSRETFE
jgi:cytochrome b561